MRGFVWIAFFLLLVCTHLPAELHPLGCIFEDPRKISWIHEAHIEVTTTRTQVDLSSFMPPVGNQLTQGSCIAWAVGYYHKTYQEWFEHRWNVNIQSHQFSPAFMYNQINGGVDQGVRFSDATKCLCDHGCANLLDSPYNPNDSTTWPSEQAYINAIPFRSDSAFYRFCGNDAGINVVRQLLSDSIVVTIGIECWSTNFDNIEDYDTMFCVADTGTGHIRGGHAVTIVGYNDSKVTHDGTGAFRLINSWGTGWGNSGYFWMSYEAVKHPRLSGGFVYYTTDKTAYSPNLRVRYRLNHPTRGRIATLVGIGSSTKADWIKDFFNWSKPTIADWPFPAQNVVLDISDGDSFLDSTAVNNIFLRCRDTLTDAQAGSIVYFSCDHLGWGANSVSTETPQVIPDDGTPAIVNLSLEYPEPDISVAPDTLVFFYVKEPIKKSKEPNPYNYHEPQGIEASGNICKLDEELNSQSPLSYISSFSDAHNTSLNNLSPPSCSNLMPVLHKICFGNGSDLLSYRHNSKNKDTKVETVDTLHYDGPYSNNAIGLTLGGTYEAGIRLTQSELAGYNGWKIISVLFYHHETATHSCAAKIYGNNTPILPGALMSQEDYSAAGSGWHRIDLTYPVVINSSNDVWVSVEVTHAAGEYPIGIDAGPAVAGKGRWIFLNSTWIETGYDNNWNVRAIVSSGDTVNTMFVKNIGLLDLNVTNITGSQAWITDISPTNFTVSPGDSQSVTVTVTKDALSDGDHYAYLSIYSDDPDDNPYTEPVKFIIRTKPDVSASPDTLEFTYSPKEIREPSLPKPSKDDIIPQNYETYEPPSLFKSTVDTIFYDDGYYRYYNGSVDLLWAVRFTPSYACSIIGALTAVYNPNGITSPCTLWVWDDDSGVPGIIIGGPLVFGTPNLTWQFTPLSVEVTRSDFHIGYWVPGGISTEGPFALTDSGSVGRSQNSSGGGWTQITQGDLLIRAVVSYGEPPSDTVQNMQVYNIGNSDLNVTNITGSESWITDINPTTFSITPGDSQGVIVTVTRDALGSGTHYAYLSIYSDDPDENPYNETVKFVVGGGMEITDDNQLPRTFFLTQNSPNPFSKATRMEYGITKDCHVNICVYNLSGRKVADLTNGYKKAGHYDIGWDGIDHRGVDLPPGIYFYTLHTDECRITKKMILIR